ncbi:putative proline-rich receptor-like protein kinase PERK6 isoform X2 [Salvia miltiorrhiza]|uniref:putative proline-rich receptor-like protein kinase PERK6 isoform X2 n=1 Tax=Salvia miltiorrhiza TaxID=226208 RepID=UPI0025AC876C|nr:putative proline-rich receptor-like protein kinase PERK6 isoform X2 [Salvia miltiorrhiza]
MRILQETSSAPLSAPSPPPPISSSPPPPPTASSPPPPNWSSPPPPLRKSPPPSNNTKPRGPPPPQLLSPSELDEDWSGGPPQALAESISFPWPPPSNKDREHAIIGSAVGVGMVILFFIICCICCCRKKKRKNRDDSKNYYQEKPHNSGGNYYNNTSHRQRNWQNNAGYRTMDGNMKYPVPASSGVSSEQWMPAPPPPPPMLSAQSSGGFSGPPLPPPHPAMMWSGYNQSTFSYNDLAAATGGFAQANLLGQGGFGYVHKGVLPNGKEVAVKSLKSNSGQGEREFQAEVDIISRVHHRHLVSLVGYCIAGSQRMLVYEYVPNSTLEDHLHGTNRQSMEFSTRLRIALGAAKGFAYLHEDCHPRIIHRDIKAANILLDNNFEAKVADFGLAKLSSDNNTHVSTRIMGTFGYLAPEYASSGKLTDKSDVYSFGIVLLELITGRRPVDITRDDDDDTLVDWARPILTNVVGEGGSYVELMDPRLEGRYEHGEALRMVTAAAACIRQSARRRPKMSQVVRALEGDVSLDDLQEVMKAQGSLSASNSEYDLQRLQKSAAGMSNQSFTTGSDVSDYSQSSSNEMRRPNTGFHLGP